MSLFRAHGRIFSYGIVLLFLLQSMFAVADNSSEEESDDGNGDGGGGGGDVQSEGAPSSSSPYVKDPFLFYKWPGVGQQEGVVGRLPWWPLIPYQIVADASNKGQEEVEKDVDTKDVQDDEEEDEEDEEDDDEHHYRPHYNLKSYKHKPSVVHSVGIGPAKGHSTWYGVLKPEVNSRTDLNDSEEDEDQVPHLPIYPYPYQANAYNGLVDVEDKRRAVWRGQRQHSKRYFGGWK